MRIINHIALIQIIGILISLSFIYVISNLIIKGKLREEYAIIWLFIAVVLIIFSIWRKAFDIIGHAFGIIDPPNLFFSIFLFICLSYLLHLSVRISKIKKQIKELAQSQALLEQKLRKYLPDQ